MEHRNGKIANAKSHTHLQFAPAIATPKIVKEYVLANASKFAERKARQVTIKLQCCEVGLRFIVASVGLLPTVADY